MKKRGIVVQFTHWPPLFISGRNVNLSRKGGREDNYAEMGRKKKTGDIAAMRAWGALRTSKLSLGTPGAKLGLAEPFQCENGAAVIPKGTRNLTSLTVPKRKRWGRNPLPPRREIRPGQLEVLRKTGAE